MNRHIHFVGIGGAGLSALAQVMLGRGYIVSGSDSAAPNPVVDELERRGATTFSKHAAQNIAGAELVVVTSAAQVDNPEIVAAHSRGIPILKRREFLREVTAGCETIAIAGSHGKTTTTAMIALILTDAGLDPTAVVGGTLPEWGTNARSGKRKGFGEQEKPLFVIEADEYDYAFLGLEPDIAVVTNVDYDHPDLFPTRQTYQNAFADFLQQTRADGTIVVCGDDATARNLAQGGGRRVVSYGVMQGNEWRAAYLKPNALGGSEFAVFQSNQVVGKISLRVPGNHNVLNALGAVVTAALSGVPLDVSRSTLENFRGVERRFQVCGTYNGAVLVDDYAHHPAEIRATLSAARGRFPNARVWTLFQPHTFSRTRALAAEFAEAFQDADKVLLTEIFAARERDEAGMSSQEIIARMKHRDARLVESLEEAEEILRNELQRGDVLLTLGAGNVNQVARKLAAPSRRENDDA